ncbi:hypothetical protein BDW74DRAFT_177846 [Aspergillus multicolor]|uniref:uncharacterized protein n=1 Tax=Aspergillus multicolor TaxID=41759 RepID=UPI003CCCB487
MHRPIAYLYSPSLRPPVFTSDDVDYDPDTNYRPENVAGLDYYYYSWVGSYYNGTATFTISPPSIRTHSSSSSSPSSSSDSDDGDSTLCSQLQNYTYTLSYSALLAITETELDDERPQNTNAVNVVLSTSYSNFTKYFNDCKDSGNIRRSFGYESTNSIFNLSMSDCDNLRSGSDRPYRLTSSSSDETSPLPTLQTNMSSCSKIQDWWGITFDAHSANFALISGAVMNMLRREDDGHDEEETPQLAGRIAVEFLGSIDGARSDVLDEPGSEGEPRWIRFVAFGNYAANLDLGEENMGSAVAGVGSWGLGLMRVVGYLLP